MDTYEKPNLLQSAGQKLPFLKEKLIFSENDSIPKTFLSMKKFILSLKNMSIQKLKVSVQEYLGRPR